MKTAVCFSGTARSLQYTCDNIKEELINPLGDCDIFAFISENKHSCKFKHFFSSQKQVKKIVVEEDPDVDVSCHRFRPNWPLPPSSKEVYTTEKEHMKDIGKTKTYIGFKKTCKWFIINYEG